MDKSVIASTIAQSSAILLPTSFAACVAMLDTWLEIVPTGNVEQIGVTMLQGLCLAVAQLVGLAVVMLLIENTR